MPTNIPTFTYKQLIPPGINFFHTAEDYRQSYSVVPSNRSLRIKLWADTTINKSWYDQFLTGPVTYRLFARDGFGKAITTNIGSPEFYDTYGNFRTLVETYKEFGFILDYKVPFLISVDIPQDEASTLNIVGNTNLPPMDYPVVIKSDTLVILDSNGEPACVKYQDFIKYARATPNSIDSKIEIIKSICNSSKTSQAKYDAIRLIVQGSNGETYGLT